MGEFALRVLSLYVVSFVQPNRSYSAAVAVVPDNDVELIDGGRALQRKPDHEQLDRSCSVAQVRRG